MALGTILTIIIIALIISLVLKIVFKIARVFFYFGLMILLIFLVTGFLILKDANDFKQNFAEKGNIVLLEEDGTVIAGYTLENDPRSLTQGEVALFSTYLQNNEFDRILKDKFKLMIIKMDLISGLEAESIDLGTASIKKESMVDVLKSDDPFKSFNEAIFEDEFSFDTKLKDDSLEFKASLLSSVVNEELIGTGNALNFFRQYKEGNLIIYPETPLFKFVKIIPLELIKSVLKNSFVKANEVTGDAVGKIENLL
jgi:energy-coupling factor transporter transmembrane protein EcfT|tara:strand:- start:301 stop:1065 length:765 start_codon:yes stop_codon:yes gene_type:complete